MKKLSILISVFMVLASVFYALTVISGNNECTSVRKYYCTKIESKDILANTGTQLESTGTISDTLSGELLLVDEKVKADILPTGEVIAKSYDTKLSKIISKDLIYEMVYDGKDSIIIDISKDRFWTEKVVINGKELSREEINAYFYTK